MNNEVNFKKIIFSNSIENEIESLINDMTIHEDSLLEITNKLKTIINNKNILNIFTKIINLKDNTDKMNNDFRSIGIYLKKDFSNYFINREGLVITKYRQMNLYKDCYYLKPLEHKYAMRLNKKKLIEYVFN